MAYATRTDMELIYGQANLDRYADVDNTGSASEKQDRISWSLEYATAEVDARLASGPYSVPFASPYPKMIVLLTASLAGLFLYDTRRIIGSEDPDRTTAQRTNVDKWFRRILAGQMDLLDPTTGERLPKSSENSPFVVTEV